MIKQIFTTNFYERLPQGLGWRDGKLIIDYHPGFDHDVRVGIIKNEVWRDGLRVCEAESLTAMIPEGLMLELYGNLWRALKVNAGGEQ